MLELEKRVFVADTVFSGWASVDFDDNFIRHLRYRNFYDPYDWHRANGSSSWDIFAVVALARDLRPEGLNWPRNSSGRPSLKLIDLARANQLSLPSHQAASDVKATIELAQLVRAKQPQLFNYLANHRQPSTISQLISSGEPFIYSGYYYPDRRSLKTTVAIFLAEDLSHPQNFICYDLRIDPQPFLDLSRSELRHQLTHRHRSTVWPFLTIAPSKSPAIVPLSALRSGTDWDRLQLQPQQVENYRQQIVNSQLGNRIGRVLAQKPNRPPLTAQTVDQYLYWGGLIPTSDHTLMKQVRQHRGQLDQTTKTPFKDPRLNYLLPLYRARNWPNQLTAPQRTDFDNYIRQRLKASDYSLADFLKSCRSWALKSTDDEPQLELIRELYQYVVGRLPIN